jgi:hypothetical protein
MANNQSYNQVIDRMNLFFNAHRQVKRFQEGPVHGINPFVTTGQTFPTVYAYPLFNQVNTSTQNLTFELYCLDRLNEDVSNERDCYSDCSSILIDFVKWFRNNNYPEYDIVGNPTIRYITNYTVENLAGAFMTIVVEADYDNTDCDIPLNPFNFPVFSGNSGQFSVDFLTCSNLADCGTFQLVLNDIDNLYYLVGQLSGGTGTDIYTTGATFNSNSYIATFNRNDGQSYFLNLSSLSGGSQGGNFLPISGGTLTGPVFGTDFNGTFIGDGSGLTGLTSTNYWTLSGANLFNNAGTNIGLNQPNPQFNLDTSGTTNLEYLDSKLLLNNTLPFFGAFATGATIYSTDGAAQPQHYYAGVLNPGIKASSIAYINEANSNELNISLANQEGVIMLHYDDVTIQNTGRTQIKVSSSGNSIEGKTQSGADVNTQWIQQGGAPIMQLQNDGLSTDPAPYRVVTVDANNILHSALITDILTGSTAAGDLQTVTDNGNITTNALIISGATFRGYNPEDSFSFIVFDTDNANNQTAGIGTNVSGNGFITIYDSGATTVTTIENGNITITGQYFGDGSQLTGIPDIYTTGATLVGTTLTFSRNDGNTYSVGLSSLTGGTGTSNPFITGGTFDQTTRSLLLNNSTGGTITITGITDSFITGGTYTNATGTLILANNTGGTISIPGFTTGGTSSTSLVVSSTTIQSGTSGNILFQSGSTLWQNSNLFWDNPNNRLSIRNGSNPGAILDLRAAGITATDLSLRIRNSGNTANNFLIDGTGRLGIGGNTATGNNLFAFDTGSAGSGYYLGTASAFTTSNAYLQIFTGGFKMQFGAVNDGFQFNKTSTPGDNWYFNNITSGGIRQLSVAESVGTTGQFLFYNNNFGLSDATTIGATPTRTLWIKNGTAPSAGATDAFQLYSADISAGNAAAHLRNENGDIIKLYQQTTAVSAATRVHNNSQAIHTDDTFDGYTMAQIVKALRNAGFLA